MRTLAPLLCLLPAVVLAQDLDLEIRGSSGRAYRVAVQRFASDAGSTDSVEPLYEELVRALEFASVFKAVPTEAFLQPLQTEDLERPSVPCESWRAIGADALLEGRLERMGGTQRIRYRVWDIGRCRVQGRPTRIDVNPADLWLAARRIGDEIVERFTGRRGVASTQIAFVSDAGGNKEIYVMEADGTRRRRVTGNRQINLFPAWSPDGNTILYTSTRGGAADLWTLSRGRPGRRLKELPHEKYRGIYGPLDGQVTFVMSQNGNTDLFITRSDGRGIRRLTDSRAIEVSPTWSPDGQRLAFASDRSGSQQIYLKDLATDRVRRLTFRGNYNATPAWSPTGEWIAYAARTEAANFDLYLIDADTGYTTQLTDHPRTEEGPAWSPDGRKLVFASDRRGRKDLYIVDLDGRNLRRITDGFGNSSNPAWSGWFQ